MDRAGVVRNLRSNATFALQPANQAAASGGLDRRSRKISYHAYTRWSFQNTALPIGAPANTKKKIVPKPKEVKSKFDRSIVPYKETVYAL